MKYKYKLRIREKFPRCILNPLSLVIKVPEILYYNIVDGVNLIRGILSESERKRSYELLLYAHILEKGLSNQEVRRGFGKISIRALGTELKNWKKREYSTDNSAYQIVLSALYEWAKQHPEESSFLMEVLGEDIFGEMLSCSDLKIGGSRIHNKQLGYQCFEEYSKNCVSIREYSEEEVKQDVIEKIVEVAKTAPSSCNRQAIKSYVVLDQYLIEKIFIQHSGLLKKPFGYIVITSDIAAYPNAKSRSLPYIDAGIFANNLVLAAAELGVGAVILNACFNHRKERNLKEILEVSKTEKIAVLIGFGKMKDTNKVCKSCRIPLYETLEMRK